MTNNSVMTTQVEGYCYICVCHICYTRDTIIISNLCEKQCFISLVSCFQTIDKIKNFYFEEYFLIIG